MNTRRNFNYMVRNRWHNLLTDYFRPIVKALLLLTMIPALPVFGANGVWTSTSGGSWADTANWSGGVIADGIGSTADFSTLALSADASVTMDGNHTNGIILFGDASSSYNWNLNGGSGGVLTMAASSGAPILTVNNQSVTIGVPMTINALIKNGPGTLVFTGTNNFPSSSSSLVVTNGTLTYSGAGASTVNGYVYVGDNNGRAVLNMNSSGTVNLQPGGSGKIYVGGTASSGGGTDTGAGVVNQTSGTVYVNAGQNIRFGSGSATSYGCYNLQGGTLTISGTAQNGYGGVGVFNQSGGTLTVTKYFGLGEYNGAVGVATFIGGTAAFDTAGGADISIGDGGNSSTYGTFNVGTLAGGNAVVTVAYTSGKGTRVGSVAGVTGNLNLNRGAYVVNGPIYRANATANAYVNFDGGTLQAGSTCTVLNNNLSAVYVYRDGAVMDSQSYTATSLANLTSAPGNGIYPSGGGWTYTDGAGYIGAPAVTVSGGSGSGAQAVATVSGGQVTGVVMTCPGQNYLAGDSLTFAFSGGGATSPAASFLHTLTAGEVSANNTGGLVKLGSGTLTLSGTNTYNGVTAVNAGTLLITPANGGALGDYTVAGGTTLKVRQNFVGDALAVSALALDSGSSLTLDETNAGAPLIVVANTLTTASTVTLNLASLIPAVGQYPLIKYGSLGGAGFDAIALGTTPFAPELSLSLSNNTANQSIDLVVAAAAATLTWNGNINGSWDIGGTANWQGGAFYTETAGVGPILDFDDTASGTTAITLDTTVSPTTMVVSNNNLTYSITGSGVIAGNGGLLKQGSGTLTLATANTFTNLTTISGGTFQLGDESANNGSVGGSIIDNAALIVADPNPQTMDNVISGTGSLIKSGNGTLTLTSSNTLSGAVSINAGTLALNQGGTGGSSPVLGSVSSVGIASGATLALNGANALGFSNNTALPPVSIAGGGTLNSIGLGVHSIGNLSIGDPSAGGILSGDGGILVNGNLTNISASTINAGSLTYNGTNIFLTGSSSVLTVDGNLSFVYPYNAGTVISGDPNGSPGILTTKGNVTGNASYVELDYMTWNVDIGTNTLNIYSKFTIGKVGGLPALMNWISGNGLIAPNNYFTLADSFTGINGASQGELDVSGGSLVISNNNARCLIGNSGNGTINVSGGTLSFMGNSSVQLGGDINYLQNNAQGTLTISGNGSVVIGPQSGGLRLAADKGTYIGITGTINLNGGTLTTWPGIINGSTGGGGSSYISFNGGTLKAGTNNATFLQGLTLAIVQFGGAVIDDGGNIITIGQALADGGGGLTKLGSGTLTLTNTSTYSGATTVSNGTLQVDGSLSVSPVTVASGATLSGNGILGAAVTVNDGGTLAPGTNSPGTLTINGDLTLDGSLIVSINKNLTQSNSMTIVSGVLTNSGAGTVTITNLGPDLAVGDSFKLFSQPVLNGDALSILSSGGVTWTNNLAVDGSIQVLSVTPPINPLPGVIQFSLSGNTLALSWPTNLGWILQAQTNTLSTGLNTNWVNVPGSDIVTNMIFNVDPANGAVFYRMIHP